MPSPKAGSSKSAAEIPALKDPQRSPKEGEGREETSKVMSMVEEAVLRLYQRRCEEAKLAGAELEGMLQSVANKMEEAEVALTTVAGPYEEALKQESVRRAALVQEIESRYQAVSKSINRAKAAAQESCASHLRDLVAAKEAMRAAQMSLSSALEVESKSTFNEQFRVLMDGTKAAVEQGKKLEDLKWTHLLETSPSPTLRRIVEREGLSRLAVREELYPATSTSAGADGLSSVTRQQGHDRDGHSPGVPTGRRRHRMEQEQKHLGKSRDKYERLHPSSPSSGHRRAKEVARAEKQRIRQSKRTVEMEADRMKDEIIRDLLHSYEELEELYRIAVIEKRAAQSGLLERRREGGEGTTSIDGVKSGEQKGRHATAAGRARSAASSQEPIPSLSQRVSFGLLRLSKGGSPSKKRAPLHTSPTQSSSSCPSSGQGVRQEDDDDDDELSECPSNPEVSEVLAPSRSPRLPRPHQEGGSGGGVGDRLSHLLHRLEHVEHMLEDISSSEAGSPHIRGRRRERRKGTASGCSLGAGGVVREGKEPPQPRSARIEDRLEEIELLLAKM